MELQHEENIKKLYLMYHDRLICYAIAITRSTDDAEEAVQEVFRIACQKPEDLSNSENPFGWLIKTLKYVLSNVSRTQTAEKKAKQSYMRQFADSAVTEPELPIELVYQDLSSTKEFTLIKELAVDGRTNEELSARYGITT